MNIDIEKIQAITKGDEIFLSPEGEKALLDIIEVENQIKEVKDRIKQQLEQTGLKVNPNFKMIQGDKIRVYYRSFGSRYFIEPGREKEVPAELVEEKVSLKLNIKELDKWVTEKGALPFGVAESDRNKQITFRLRKEADAEV